jgi:thiol:disulfide interchange protein DsbD
MAFLMKKCVLLLVLSLCSIWGYAQEPLPGNQVFSVESKVIDPNNVGLEFRVKPGYFLYKNRIKLANQNQEIMHLGDIRWPTPDYKQDPTNGNYPIYRQTLTLAVPILGEKQGQAKLRIHFQGCADSGFCYPPMEKTLAITIDNELGVSQVKFITSPTIEAAESDEISSLISHKSFVLVLLSFFGFGLLLAFTPCVLPMVPVLSGIIIGHGDKITTRKAFFLSLSYVLAMSVTYAIAGIIVAALGSNLQAAFQAPWIITLFSLLFVLLALSMFGFYELKLPLSWQARLSNISQNQAHGHYMGAAIMGFLSTLILSPCVTAPLIGVLGYIANTGDMALGGMALFFLGLGMGTPLLLIGTSAGKLIPQTGQWMNAVKAFFGVLLLAVAIYLISRVIPENITMLLWASLLIISSIYLGALHSPTQTNAQKFWKGSGLITLLYGGLLIVGASMGNTDPLQPLAGLNRVGIQETHTHDKIRVTTVKDVEQALENSHGKIVMLDFYADWCTACKIMEKTTFQDSRVIQKLANIVILKADVTANDTQNKALQSYFNVVAPPTFIFFDKNGNEIKSARIVGEKNAEQFLKVLDKVEM